MLGPPEVLGMTVNWPQEFSLAGEVYFLQVSQTLEALAPASFDDWISLLLEETRKPNGGPCGSL